jgi:hypothetical protein
MSCRHSQLDHCPLCACSAKLDDCFAGLRAIEAQPSEVLVAVTGRDKSWWDVYAADLKAWANSARRSLGEPEQ